MAFIAEMHYLKTRMVGPGLGRLKFIPFPIAVVTNVQSLAFSAFGRLRLARRARPGAIRDPNPSLQMEEEKAS